MRECRGRRMRWSGRPTAMRGGPMRTSTRLLALAAILTIPAVSTHAASPVLEATYTSSLQNGWVRVERWRDPGAAFTQETFPPDGRGDQSGQRVTFFAGDSTPHSSRFLMYYAP